MQTTNVSTLKIHKLTKAQYDRELAAGNIDEYALYLTPDEEQPSIVTTSGTGEAYTATVDSITELTAGVSFVMIPNTVSTTTMPSLNVNNLGAKYIRRRLSSSTSTAVAGSTANWLGANKPVRVIYDGTYWIVDITRPSATDIYGVLPITAGGTGSTNGATALANLFGAGYTVLSSYQYGDTLPEPGTPGRIFFKKVNS